MKNFSTAILATLAAAAGQTATCGATNTTSLRFEADKGDILIGSGTINPNYLNDTQVATTLAGQFKSLSPENEMKWSFLHPTPDHYNWYNLDRLVDFADEHDMVVKGHGLISGCCNPEYLLDITDPVEFRAAMKTHFEAIMHRYEGKMDRWDVVTEILITQGGGLDTENNFYKVLGPEFVQIALEIAREAAPNAKLFLCENLVETQRGKRKELYDLVSDLVAVGAPIDGLLCATRLTRLVRNSD